MSRTCFAWRSWWAAIISIHPYTLRVPRKGCFQQYWLRSRDSVSARKESVRSRAHRRVPSITSFSAKRDGSCGTGDFRRITRFSTSHMGRCHRLEKGMGSGAFCVTESAFARMPRSTTTKCATTSAADHCSGPGCCAHCATPMASAARQNTVCAVFSFSPIFPSEAISPL